MDVTFTFNETDRIEKQISKAQKARRDKGCRLRIIISSADIAIGQYQVDNEKADESISKLKTKDGRLLRTQTMIAKHEYVLEGLLNPTLIIPGL